MADINAGANANAGHSTTIEQSSLDNHHGASQYLPPASLPSTVFKLTS